MAVKLFTIDDRKNSLRKLRSEQCFPIVNRGLVWYDTLTNEQIIELTIWYYKWLDVTETLKVPEEPKWLKDKIVQGELLL